MLALVAVVLPILFWQGDVKTAAELRRAGIRHIAVARVEAAQWKTIREISVEPIDVAATVKLAAPGVDYRNDEASASRLPWVISNGWRFMRQANARFYYKVPARGAALAAAEAFCYGGEALIETDVNGIAPLAQMIEFLRSINDGGVNPLGDIDFNDDGSPLSAEVMNLMIRHNLLFEIAHGSKANGKLLVKPASKEYGGTSVKDADSIAHKIRANLTDPKRSVRIFGTSLVIVRLTGEPDKPRLHLLNYGAAADTRVGGFRVRVLGRYAKYQIHSFDSPDEQLMDYEIQPEATEFTVPELKTYAVVDFYR